MASENRPKLQIWLSVNLACDAKRQVAIRYWRLYATGQLEDSGWQNDEKMSLRDCAFSVLGDIFRYFAVLSLPAVLFSCVRSL